MSKCEVNEFGEVCGGKVDGVMFRNMAVNCHSCEMNVHTSEDPDYVKAHNYIFVCEDCGTSKELEVHESLSGVSVAGRITHYYPDGRPDFYDQTESFSYTKRCDNCHERSDRGSMIPLCRAHLEEIHTALKYGILVHVDRSDLDTFVDCKGNRVYGEAPLIAHAKVMSTYWKSVDDRATLAIAGLPKNMPKNIVELVQRATICAMVGMLNCESYALQQLANIMMDEPWEDAVRLRSDKVTMTADEVISSVTGEVDRLIDALHKFVVEESRLKDTFDTVKDLSYDMWYKKEGGSREAFDSVCEAFFSDLIRD